MRRIRAEVYLFSLQVESHAKLFQLMRYPRLKDPIEYANSTWKFWQRKDLSWECSSHRRSDSYLTDTFGFKRSKRCTFGISKYFVLLW